MDLSKCFAIDSTKSWADISDEEDEIQEQKKVHDPPVKVEQTQQQDDGWSFVSNQRNQRKKNVNNDQGNKVKVCVICKDKFIFTKDEAEFFQSKGWDERKKCKICKKQQKMERKYGTAPNHNRKQTLQLNNQ